MEKVNNTQNQNLTATPIVQSIPSFGFNMSISAGDLIAAGMTQVETQLQATIDENTANGEALTPKVKKAVEAVKKEAHRVGVEKVKKIVEAFKVAMKATKGSTLEISVNSDIQSVEVGQKRVPKLVVRVYLEGSARSSHHFHQIQRAMEVHEEVLPVPASVKKLEAELQKLEKEQSEFFEIAAKSQNEIYNIDKYERRLRAQLTQQQLAQSQEGQQLVEGLNNFLTSMGFNALPPSSK